MDAFLLRVGERSSRDASSRALVPCLRAPPWCPDHLPQVTPSHTITQGVRASTDDLGGHRFSPQLCPLLPALPSLPWDRPAGNLLVLDSFSKSTPEKPQEDSVAQMTFGVPFSEIKDSNVQM